MTVLKLSCLCCKSCTSLVVAVTSLIFGVSFLNEDIFSCILQRQIALLTKASFPACMQMFVWSKELSTQHQYLYIKPYNSFINVIIIINQMTTLDRARNYVFVTTIILFHQRLQLLRLWIVTHAQSHVSSFASLSCHLQALPGHS